MSICTLSPQKKQYRKSTTARFMMNTVLERQSSVFINSSRPVTFAYITDAIVNAFPNIPNKNTGNNIQAYISNVKSFSAILLKLGYMAVTVFLNEVGEPNDV